MESEHRVVTGLRAELAVEGADACPVAAASDATSGPIQNVEWTRSGDEGAVERFAVDDVGSVVNDRKSEAAADDSTDESSSGDANAGSASEANANDAAATEFDPVFTDGDGGVVEFERDWDACVCEVIEATGCPVETVEARDGALLVTVHTRSRDRLKTVIGAAREAAGDVSLNYVVTGDGRDATDPVVVDRGRLTDRQREVLATAYEHGYFEHPRRANAAEVADVLGVAPATFREHLAAAQEKLLGGVVEA